MFRFHQNTSQIFSFLSAMVLCSVLPNCAGSGDKNDPCEGTIKPQVSVNITYDILIYYHSPGDATRIQIPHCPLIIQVQKNLCEGGSKGLFACNDCYTTQFGRYSYTVGYNLQNSKDSIYARVDAYPNNPNLSYVKTATDTISFSEAAASGGTMNRTITIDFLANS